MKATINRELFERFAHHAKGGIVANATKEPDGRMTFDVDWDIYQKVMKLGNTFEEGLEALMKNIPLPPKYN